MAWYTLRFCACMFWVVSNSLRTSWTVARQAPLSMEFSRQEYWSGLPFPPPGVLLNPGIEPVSPVLAGGLFTPESPGKPLMTFGHHCGIVQSSFTALRILCVLLLYPSFSAHPWQPLIFIVVPFPECHVIVIMQDVASSDWLPSLTNMPLRSVQIFSWLDSSFFLALNNTPLSGCTPAYVVIHPLKDILIVPGFGTYE